MEYELKDLLIHSRTRANVDNYLRAPAHALMVIGPAGSGKRTLSKAIAARLLGAAPGLLASYPYFLHVFKKLKDREISIEAIRELNRSLSLKTAGTNKVRRLILIEDADLMSLEAQNLLLKNLEEPSAETVFILTVPSDKAVLPTITSRSQRLTVNPVSLSEAKKYFSAQKNEQEVEKAWQLSQGSVGLLSALLNDADDHPLKEAVETAKAMLKTNPYERLLTLDKLCSDRQQVKLFLEALRKVVASLHQTAVTKDSRQQDRILVSRRLISETEAMVEENVNIRLALMRLVMNLSV